jgi:hypothetical protein
MSAHVKIDLTISKPNTLLLQRPPKRFTIPFGTSIPAESVPICESVESAYAKAISKFLHRSDKVVMDKFFLLRRRIPERCAL